MKIIGLIGLKQSGKTTALNIIRQTHPEVVEIMIADRLKEVCSEVFGISRDRFEKQELKELPLKLEVVLDLSQVERIISAFDLVPCPLIVEKHIGTRLSTPRKILQYVGSELLREIDPDIHVKSAINRMSDSCGIYVVTDIRFENELNAFRLIATDDSPFYSVYIKRGSGVSKDVHASEVEVPKIGVKADYYATNDGTIESFKDRLDNILLKIGLNSYLRSKGGTLKKITLSIVFISTLTQQSRADITDSENFEPGLLCALGAGGGYAVASQSGSGNELLYSGGACAVGLLAGYYLNGHYKEKYTKAQNKKIDDLNLAIEQMHKMQAEHAAKNDDVSYSIKVREVVPGQVLPNGEVTAPTIRERLLLPGSNLRIGD